MFTTIFLDSGQSPFKFAKIENDITSSNISICERILMRGVFGHYRSINIRKNQTFVKTPDFPDIPISHEKMIFWEILEQNYRPKLAILS